MKGIKITITRMRTYEKNRLHEWLQANFTQMNLIKCVSSNMGTITFTRCRIRRQFISVIRRFLSLTPSLTYGIAPKPSVECMKIMTAPENNTDIILSTIIIYHLWNCCAVTAPLESSRGRGKNTIQKCCDEWDIDGFSQSFSRVPYHVLKQKKTLSTSNSFVIKKCFIDSGHDFLNC